MEPFLRTEHNYDMNAASVESGLHCEDETRAKQSFRDETDINTIIRRFGVTGELPTAIRLPSYGDFTGIADFQTGVNIIAEANEAFDAMPAEVRARFHNDPHEFINFFNNEENRAEGVKLGLIIAQAEALAPAAAEVPAQAPASPVTN